MNKTVDIAQTTEVVRADFECLKTPDGLYIACHRNRIPAFVETALSQRYGSFYSSLPQVEIECGTQGVHTYVVYRGDEIVDLWLFRIVGKAVCVMNEAIPVSAASIQRFANVVFNTHRDVDHIRFNAIYPALNGLRLPYQRLHATDDSVLMLPASNEAYLSGLGKATRKNIKRYQHRLQEEFPSFTYQVFEKDAIPEHYVRAIINLNRTRMAAKGKVSGIDAAQEQRILQLVKRCGLIGVATIDGTVCAGAIVYRAGDNFFSFVRAHDPAYNEYRLGLIGACRLVDACIARGGRELHFMWGREPHKSLLGGEQRELDSVTVFRSRAHALLHADILAKHALGSLVRETKQRLFEKSKKDDFSARLLNRAIGSLRWAKRKIHRSSHPD